MFLYYSLCVDVVCSYALLVLILNCMSPATSHQAGHLASSMKGPSPTPTCFIVILLLFICLCLVLAIFNLCFCIFHRAQSPTRDTFYVSVLIMFLYYSLCVDAVCNYALLALNFICMSPATGPLIRRWCRPLIRRWWRRRRRRGPCHRWCRRAEQGQRRLSWCRRAAQGQRRL